MGEWLNELVRSLGLWGLAVLGGAAMLEYVVPPFPGDTVTLLGAVLAAKGELHWLLVWTVVTGSSGVGMALDWRVGRWLSLRAGRLPSEAQRPWWNPLSQERLMRFQYRYQRWGSGLILANRFLPAVRAIFFLAAGASGITLFRTLILGLVSAGAWNAMLLGAGYALGANLDELERLFRTYRAGAWAVLGALVVLVLGRALWRRLRA